MVLNSKRGQASIEMILLVLGILLGGTMLSVELTKNAGGHNEISGVKKVVFAEIISDYVQENTVTGSYQEIGSNKVKNESDDENDTNIDGIKIIPGNGDNVEFVIICNNSNGQTIYFLNNGKGYGTSALYANVSKGLVGISNNTFPNGPVLRINSYGSISGYATYIYVKTNGNNELANEYGNPIELEAKNPDEPFSFKITNNGGFGQYYISLYNLDYAQVVYETETKGNGNSKNN